MLTDVSGPLYPSSYVPQTDSITADLSENVTLTRNTTSIKMKSF
jgi:hypothetical protein